MYTPAHFAEQRMDVMHDLIAHYPLGTLVTLSPDGLTADHIPFHIRQDGSRHGLLVGHVARSNPLWQHAASAAEVLVIFHGPDAYVSPNWYPTKQEHGKVVPTWNYAVVHAHGRLRAIEDPAWMRDQLEELVTRHEHPQPHPWTIADAPADFTERLIGSIVGIEISINKLTGKWKVSQNQPEANQRGVIAGLHSSGDKKSALMAGLMQNYNHHKP